MRRLCAFPLILSLLAACDHAAPPAPPSYDGMRRLALAPVAELCAARDDAPCQFANAGVVAAGPDGRVAVADLLGELREFDAEGRFLRQVGRKGDGPGEYRLLMAAGYDSAGNLTVLDQRGLRVQRFDTGGRVVAAASAPFVPGLTDVRVLQGRVALFVLPGAAAIGDTVEASVLLMDPATGDTTRLAGIPEPAAATGDGTLTPIPPLFSVPAAARWSVSGDGALHVADAARLRIVRRDQGAPARAVVDLDVTPRPIPAADLEAEAARVMAVGPDMNTAMAAAFRRDRDAAVASAAKAYPMVSRLAILDDGTLLAREYPRVGADSARWNVFAADGAPRGHLVLPTRAQVAGGRLERMLVAWPGDDDVPRIAWVVAR